MDTYNYMSTYTRGIHTNIRVFKLSKKIFDTYNYLSIYTWV